MFGKKSVKIKAAASVAMSALFLSAAVFGYMDCPYRCAEMTFLSNAAVGLLLLFTGVKLFATDKDIPQFIYLDCAVLMSSVLCACAIFSPDGCFVGSSFVLHVVTPVCMILFFFLFCDGTKCGWRSVLTALVFPSIYYIFIIVYGRLTHASVYIYFNTNAIAPYKLVLVGMSAVAMLSVLAAAFIFFSKLLRGIYSRRTSTVLRTGRSNDK